MSTEKKKPVIITSPKGVAVYPHLTAPDTKYDAEGVYHTKLAFDPSDTESAKYLARLQKEHDTALAGFRKAEPAKVKKATVNAIISDELDRETGDETGRKIVNYKMYATGKGKDGTPFTRKPILYDAAGKPITRPVKIGNQSILKIAHTLSPYMNGKNVGITLYLSAVQIIKLVEFGGGSRAASEYGFGAEEGDDVYSFGNETSSEETDAEETDAEGDDAEESSDF
jgi:hypothetical protein